MYISTGIFLQHKDKEFADSLNIVEHLAEKSLKRMENDGREIPQDLTKISYVDASDDLKYFMDTCVIRAMVLDMWVKNYYIRDLPMTDIVTLARKAVEATSLIYAHTTMQAMSIKANLAAILKEDKETLREALDTVNSVEVSMKKTADLYRKEPPVNASEQSITNWESCKRNHGKFWEYKPLETCHPSETLLLYSIIGTVRNECSKQRVGPKTDRVKARILIKHAFEVAKSKRIDELCVHFQKLLKKL